MAKTCGLCGKPISWILETKQVRVNGELIYLCWNCENKHYNRLIEESQKHDEAIEQIQRNVENAREKQLEKQEAIRKEFLRIKDITVTTEDLHCKYKILAPIVFNTTNKGVFSSAYKTLSKKYDDFPYNLLIVKPKSESLASNESGLLWLTLLDANFGFEGSVGQQFFDKAFYMGVAEMKLRAAEIGANAIVGLKMDFDLDTTNYGAFYLQMYGTAVLME